MKDPWTGEQARELWNGVQHAQQEAAAYRAAFATPEDAKALKELYPGGVNEARATAERAKFLDDIDRAYFGAAGSSAEQTSAARARLAQTLLREDPAAFREMVFAGLRALEEAEKGSALAPNAAHLPRLAQITNRMAADVGPPLSAQAGFGAASAPPPAGASGTTGSAALRPAATPVAQAFRPEALSSPAPASSLDAKSLTPEGVTYSAYAAFEKAANDDLERSVGAAIAHTIQKALPNLKASNEGTGVGARHASSAPEARLAPIQARLTAAVRQDVESALKGDRQLGEQIAQILSARRFDNETRALVVRLIDERARQLIPGAAKRVLNDWTQTTLAAHRAKGERADAAAARREVAPASPVPRGPSAGGDSSRTPQAYANSAGHRGARGDRSAITPRIDYRKLSDEQILEL